MDFNMEQVLKLFIWLLPYLFWASLFTALIYYAKTKDEKIGVGFVISLVSTVGLLNMFLVGR